jgi:hypothetical protein
MGISSEAIADNAIAEDQRPASPAERRQHLEKPLLEGTFPAQDAISGFQRRPHSSWRWISLYFLENLSAEKAYHGLKAFARGG